jgi:hypothetical protein
MGSLGNPGLLDPASDRQLNQGVLMDWIRLSLKAATMALVLAIALFSLAACGRDFTPASGQPQPNVESPYADRNDD